MPSTTSSLTSKDNTANTTSNKGPTPASGKIKVVVKRRRKKKFIKINARRGLPNLTKELTEAPKEDGIGDDDEDDEFFPPMEDAIPCDTLLAFQSLTQASSTSPQLFLAIPLQASLEAIPCVLESQLVSVLQQSEEDHDSFGMVTQELPELMRKNTLRRLTSVITPRGGGGTDLAVLVLTSDYIRGVWDAHDTADTAEEAKPEERELQRCYVQWFVDHLHCFVGRLLIESKMQRVWTKDPPRHNLPYAMATSIPKALDYFQKIQILMAHHHQQREATYQLWLPQWGTVVSAVQTAQAKMLRKLQQTYQKEVSEKTFLQQPFYNGVSTRLLLQLIQDRGIVKVVPKPFGNFIRLVETRPKAKKKR